VGEEERETSWGLIEKSRRKKHEAIKIQEMCVIRKAARWKSHTRWGLLLDLGQRLKL